MTEQKMLTALNGTQLVEAFPRSMHGDAAVAVRKLAPIICNRQWTERFHLHVAGSQVTIPARIHFVPSSQPEAADGESWLAMNCLMTRSNDGFQRQTAVRELLRAPRFWSVPFIVDLIGWYVIEILDDIDHQIRMIDRQMLADFIADNPMHWRLIRDRVMSYWNVYYRREFARANYVGFRILSEIDLMAKPLCGAIT